jgi:hypothetical protein
MTNNYHIGNDIDLLHSFNGAVTFKRVSEKDVGKGQGGNFLKVIVHSSTASTLRT